MSNVNVNDVELSIAGVDVKSAAQAHDETGEFDLSKGIFRYCGTVPDDDWVKRVERLNAIIDGMNGRGRMCECGKAIVGTVVV